MIFVPDCLLWFATRLFIQIANRAFCGGAAGLPGSRLEARTPTQPARRMPTRLATAALITTLAMVPLFAHPGSAEMLYSPEGTRVIIREPAPIVLYRAIPGGVDTYQTTPGLVDPYQVSPAVVNQPVVPPAGVDRRMAPPQGKEGLLLITPPRQTHPPAPDGSPCAPA